MPVMATVLPPPLGPDTTRARWGGVSRRWLATTCLPCRTRSGWRRESSSKPCSTGPTSGAWASRSEASLAWASTRSSRPRSARSRRRPSARCPTASDSSRRMRASSSAAMAVAMESSLPPSTIASGSTKRVCPDCDALCTMPGNLGAGAGQHRHHVAVVADGEVGVAQVALHQLVGEQRLHLRLEGAVQPADAVAQGGQLGAGPVGDGAARLDGALDAIGQPLVGGEPGGDGPQAGRPLEPRLQEAAGAHGRAQQGRALAQGGRLQRAPLGGARHLLLGGAGEGEREGEPRLGQRPGLLDGEERLPHLGGAGQEGERAGLLAPGREPAALRQGLHHLGPAEVDEAGVESRGSRAPVYPTAARRSGSPCAPHPGAVLHPRREAAQPSAAGERAGGSHPEAGPAGPASRRGERPRPAGGGALPAPARPHGGPGVQPHRRGRSPPPRRRPAGGRARGAARRALRPGARGARRHPLHGGGGRRAGRAHRRAGPLAVRLQRRLALAPGRAAAGPRRPRLRHPGRGGPLLHLPGHHDALHGGRRRRRAPLRGARPAQPHRRRAGGGPAPPARLRELLRPARPRPAPRHDGG